MNKLEITMKNSFLAFLFAFFILIEAPQTAFAASGDVIVNAVNFPDANFRNYILDNYDTDKNTILSETEIKNIDYLSIYSKSISTLKGIEYLTALTYLYCNDNNLTSIDISHNPMLTYFTCDNNQLTSLDVSNNPKLTYLRCDNNQLTSLYLSKNTLLETIICSSNKLTSLNLGEKSKLVYFHCSDNKLQSLDLSKATSLITLNCMNNQLTSLNLNENSPFKSINCRNNQLTSLTLKNNETIENMCCEFNKLTNLDISNASSLTELSCGENLLTNLNVDSLPNLKYLSCSNNQIKNLNISKNKELNKLYASRNSLKSLDVSQNTKLERLYIENNYISTFDPSHNTVLQLLDITNNPIFCIDLSQNKKLTGFWCNITNYIAVTSDKTYDMSQIPGFDMNKTSDWNGCDISGNTLTNCKNNIFYTYDCGNDIKKTFFIQVTHAHNGVKKDNKEASCTEPGHKTYYKCTKCNKYFEDEKCSKEIKDDIDAWMNIPQKKHDIKIDTIYKATPNQEGYIVKKCSHCDYETSEPISYPKNITLSADTYTYNGKAKKPTLQVIDSDNKAIPTSCYSVTYDKGRKNIGTYNVTITFKGNLYDGTAIKTFTINPKNTSLKKLSAGKKSITVKWKKLTKKMKKSRISGYQIQYSTSSNFKKAKIRKIKGYKASSFKITKLKAKKKYYVRVRTYMTVNKKTYYSPWSKAKTVKTK